MSDEPTPSPTPSLRLKPRLRPDVSATPPPAIPKIAIAQTLDADGILAAGERKVFSSPASESSEETAPSATPEAEETQPKKLSLSPKLTADSKSKRFSLPAANPTSSAKRLPPSIAPTPGLGDDGAPQEDEDVHLGPTSYAKVDTSADEGASAAAGPDESPTAYADERPLSEEEPDSPETAQTSEESVSSENVSSGADANGIKTSDAAGSSDGEALGAPHPEADIPTRFSPPASETGEATRFKLKPRLSAPENPPMHGGVSLPPAIPSASHPAPPPGIKIVPTAPVGPSSGSLPVKVPLQPRASANGVRQVRRVVVKSGQPRILKYFLITVGVLAAIGMAVGGFMGFRYLAQLEKHPATEQPAIVVPIKKPNSPVKTPAPKSAAGRIVEEAQAAANSQLAEIDSTTETSPKAVTGSVAKAAVPPGAGTAALTAGSTHAAVATVTVAPVAVAKPAAPPPPKVAPPPSAEFRTVIVNLRVNGVFQGAHPRALLNGRLLNAGEILDQTLQVRFMGIDAVHKQLLFEDGAGSVVQRHY